MAREIFATGTDLQIATDILFNTVVNTDDGTYRVTDHLEPGSLPYGVTLWARARHVSEETGAGPWSDAVRFQIETPASIIGVCLDHTDANTRGTFTWIDVLGNPVEEFNYQDHPTYKNITMVTTDSGRAPVTLTRFPKFYIKTAASGPAGTYADGKKCWWISDLPEEGFRPAACFKRSTTKVEGKYQVSDYCYMGTYLGHTEQVDDKTCLGSKVGQTVAASTTKANFKTWITNRNDSAAGETGYRMFDIWDLSALRLLALIGHANANTQSAWGDNGSAATYPKTGSTQARLVFQGTQSTPTTSIEDLWRCYWYHVDAILVDNGKITLTSPMDLSSALSFGSAGAERYTQPTTSGWVSDILDCPVVIGDDTHDLMELFLPKLVTTNETAATWYDYYDRTGGTTALQIGGSYDVTTRAGLWGATDIQDSYQTSYQELVNTIYHPAVPPVYGEPYTGCGYDYYAKRNNTSMPVRWSHRRYPVGSSTLESGSVYVSAINRCESRTVSYYSAGCTDGETDICPIAGVHLPSSRCGRPYATLITPGQEAWTENVYETRYETHYYSTVGARLAKN